MKRLSKFFVLFCLVCINIFSFSQKQKNDSISIHKELSEVEVKSSRIKTTYKKTAEPVKLILEEDIKNLNTHNLGDVLKYSNGLSIETGTGGGLPKRYVVSINGFPANYNLVLVNGQKLLTEHIHTGQNLELIPVEVIEQIEILRGAHSAQYGSDAMGGIINIITKKTSKENKMSFKVYGGSYDTYGTNLITLVPLEKNQNISVYTGWEQSHGQKVIKPVSRIGNLGYTRYSTFNSYTNKISENIDLCINANYVKNTARVNNINYDSWLVMPGMQWSLKPLQKFHIYPNLYYTEWFAEQNSENHKNLNPELQFQYIFTENNKLLLGSDFKYIVFKRNKVQEHIQRCYGLYLQERLILFDKLYLSATGRLDKVDEREFVFSPTISAMYNINDFLRIRLSSGQAYHAPTVQEMYEEGFGHTGRAYRFGNPDLKPEYSLSNVISLEYFYKNLIFEASGYYSNVKNMIIPVYKGPWPKNPNVDMWVRQNIQEAEIAGFDVSLSYHLNNLLSISGGYSFTHNKDKHLEKELPYYPGQSITGKINFKKKLTKWLDVELFSGVKAVSGRSAWNWKPAPDKPYNDETGLKTVLKDYQNLEAGISLDVNQKLKFYFNVSNLLKQELEFLDDAHFIYEGKEFFKVGLIYNVK